MHDYVCAGCAKRWPAGDFPGPIPIYNLGDGNVAPLRRRAAWCETCNTVTRAEHLPRSPEEVEAGIRKALDDSQRYAVDDDAFMRQCAALDARYVASSDAWRKWAVERRGTGERCLRCGSDVPALEVLEGSADWPMRFRHPECGGEVAFVEGGLRVAWVEADLETLEFGRDGRSFIPKPALYR